MTIARTRGKRRRFRWHGMALAAALAVTSVGALAQQPCAGQRIYVADFELDAANIQPDEGRAARARRLVGSLLPGRAQHNGSDSQARAAQIVSQMSQSLIADLDQAGLQAIRLPPGVPLASNGWLLRGVFLSVDEGNRLRRAVVGFGQGQTSFQVAIAMDDLASPGGPKTYYQTTAAGKSGDMPGAVVTMNPYAVAAKFMLDAGDLDRTLHSTAQKIAASVAAQLHCGGTANEPRAASGN